MDVVIVGGGISGLITANRLADAGVAVTIIERREHLGGRARCDQQDGFILNQGPHALYRRGALATALTSMGIAPSGGAPDLRRGVSLMDSGEHPLPSGAVSMLTSRMFGARGKRQLAGFLTRTGRAPADPTLSAAAWINRHITDPRARSLVHALTRLATYTAHLDKLPARVAGPQLAVATKGVAYLDGGWDTIVQALTARAVARGVQLRQAEVTGITSEGTRWDVQTTQGLVPAGAVVAAVASPKAAAALTPGLVQDGEAPSQVAVLDVGLSELPDPQRMFALSLDSPHYVSVHSPPAKLAERGVLLSAMEYLTDERDGNARARLEVVMDRFQPGWRERVITTRYLPAMTVTHAIPTAGTARATVAGADRPGLLMAGDWVEGSGLLADASASRAHEAAGHVIAHLRNTR